ncbi:PDZ domain-containing protein [Leptobacterium flavescens]|uniref:Tricorn protease homolog n=1 Tax=Leptobacterium flavescens TaxID=472055 RepID=A0A6P0ULQ3_9FLAO|nr:S41 family peptidase [Leptobacterium flavescens]NER13927.1 PDZ domain-containing protein [Leptobacterium flavescens]
MKLFFRAFLIAISAIGTVNAQNPLINFPSVSPDGRSIAFNFQGDIWTTDINGQNARRVTVHEAYDTRPLWSHDGKSIAFQSNRYGNDDIYIIPATGGLPKRITYHSAFDAITDFTKDGDILFTTRRDFAQVERENEIFRINEKGGTPSRYMNSLGFDAVLSPNGNFIAFVKGSCRLEREAYQGPANRDLWLYNIKNDSYIQLTNFDGNDFYPQWGDNNTIYFQSSRSGKYNVHKLQINENGQRQGSPEQVSSFNDMGIFSFKLSANGKDIVAVKGDKVYVLDASSNASREININIGSDYRLDPVVHRNYTNNISEVAPSPDGQYSAMVIRGEIFITENDTKKNRTVNVSDSPYRDRMISWLNDSSLLFVSDRDGQNDLYVVQSDDPSESNLFKTLKRKITRITRTEEEESNPILSPDGKSIAFLRGRGKLIVANIDENGKLSGQKTLLDGWDTPGGVSWSPDSKWLAYSLGDLDFNDEIYVHKADNSAKPVNISMHPKQDFGPIWSKDGKKIVFSSNRNNGDYDVWFVWLNKVDWEKTNQDWDEEKEEKTASKDKKEGQKEVKPVTIDFDNIYERQVQVTSYTGGEFAQLISNDGKTIYYTTGNGSRGNARTESDLFKIKWDGTERKAVTKGNTGPSNIVANKKQSQLYLTRRRGSLARINLSNDKTESLPILARMDINYPQESAQIFDEAWKGINDGFYDPNFHGQDWGALKRKYKPLAMKASTRRDFQTVFNWMLGQINASHMGLRGGEVREDLQREITGLLGVEIEPQSNGSVKVTSVTPSMPGDRVVSKINQGDIILSVNGTKLSSDTNFYSLFTGTSNEKIYLEVRRGNTTKEIIIRPKGNNRVENYNAWVKERKRLTDQYSGGKLGYIHIQGMNWPSFERFERELAAAGHGKEGIVIDVRYNGGGWTTDYLMAVLNVRQHAYTVPRGAAKNLEREHRKFINHYPFSERLPLAAWTKPSIALSNHRSYSNAEIFAHAYKTLGIGKLVGESTFGAVISTGGRGLIDGSAVRMPFRGWYVKATQSNMELGPAVPDIEVDNAPDDKAKGKDTQLKRAVDELLKQLGN